MLRVNQLSGFGGRLLMPPKIITQQVGAGDIVNWNPDLGPAGRKQVFFIMSCNGVKADDPWVFGDGTFAGGPWDWVYPGSDVQAGNGLSFTGGVTIRAKDTELGGVQTLQSTVVGYTSNMAQSRMLCVVMRGMNSVIPLSYDGGTNQGEANGNEVTLNTTGARLVLAGRASQGAGGTFQGGGDPITATEIAAQSLGYDLSPPGGVVNYSFTGVKYVIAGAAFG